RLARAQQCGLLVTVDYGYESAELLDLRARPYGTLACYHRHRVHRDAFVHIGDQDITAHIDFGALREAGEAAGLVTVGWMRLAEWLTRLGIFDLLDAVPPGSHPEARQLLDLEGLGHDQRVLVQARGLRPAEVEQILALP